MTEQTTQNSKSMTTEPQAHPSFFDSSSIFSSQDFGKFLSKEFPTSSPFLSMDVSLASSEEPSAFKSVDAFSHLFSGDDWGMKLKADLSVAPQNDVPHNESGKEPFPTVVTSKDWIPSYMHLGPHMDVRVDPGMILGRESSSGTSALLDPLDALPPITTAWDKMYMSQLQLILPQPRPTEEESTPVDDFHPWTREALDLVSSADSSEKSLETSVKKKRNRRPRSKVVPSNKVYVEPETNDVLLGRGGRSNHHPGNKRYREEVQNLREWYGSMGDNKEEKTKLSQTLIDCIQNNGGRFLEKDMEGWYIVPNLVARRKASQALREDNDPVKRAAKRQRFLERRAREEEKCSQEEDMSQHLAV